MKFFPALHFLLSVFSVTQAFVVQTTSSSGLARPMVVGSSKIASHQLYDESTRSSMILRMSEQPEENVDTEARADAAQEEAPEEEEPPEDPEVVAVKDEIAQLESTLKEKRRELAYISDKAEEYSKSGYARKVAEMENMRRARSVSVLSILSCWTRYFLSCLTVGCFTLDTMTDAFHHYSLPFTSDAGIFQQIWRHGGCSHIVRTRTGHPG